MLTKIQKPEVARAGRNTNQAWTMYLLCDLVRPR
jgi:hypothetical protein